MSVDSVAAAASSSKKRALNYEKGLVRPKDESAPKRPLSAYFQWAAENREAAKSQCDSPSNVAEVTKKLGAMWAGLGAEERTKWESKSKLEMEAYKTKFEAYKKTSEYEEHAKELREYNIKMTYKPFKKDENMPKKAKSGYMLFAADWRARIASDNPDAKITEIMGLVAKAWKSLSDKDQKPYLEKAKVLSEEHAKVVEEYKKTADHIKYLEEKKTYLDGMALKRRRLMKQAGMEVESCTKGSGSTPNAKRKKADPKKKTSSKKSSKKKTSAKKSSKKKTPSKKKKSAPKKASKSKKSSGAKKSSKAKAASKK